MTTTPSAWAGTAALTSGNSYVRTALGLHPELAGSRQHELGKFDALLAGTEFVGEVGLDGSPVPRKTWAQQEEVFGHVLDACAHAGGKILSVHTRRAAGQALDMLMARSGYGKAILHWFTGSVSELARAVDLDCWFSVGPAMLSSTNGRMLVARMPHDKVLLETDGPFGMFRGEPSMPWHVLDLPGVLADVWGEAPQTVSRQIARNESLLLSS